MKRQILAISALAVLLLLLAAIVGKDIVIELPFVLVATLSILLLCAFLCHKDAAFRCASIGCVIGLVLLCGTVGAWMNSAVVGQGVSAAPGDSWSCTDANLICESFDATGFDNGGSISATKSQASPSTVNEDYANTTAVGCDTTNVQSLQCDNADETSNARVYWDRGSSGDWFFNYEFYVPEIAGTTFLFTIGDTNCDDMSLKCWTDSVSGGTFSVVCSTHAASLGTITGLAVNTWHHVIGQYDIGGNASVSINGTTLGTSSAHSWSARYFCLSANDPQGDNFNILFDALKAHSTSAPTCD